MSINEKTFTGNYYHIISRSIGKYRIFNNDRSRIRLMDMMLYYNYTNPPLRFSVLAERSQKYQKEIYETIRKNTNDHLVEIASFCIMPTHIHLLLKQKTENGIPIFISKLLNSYTRYFNIKYNRKGPLWSSRYKRILINEDSQLLHLTRYIHLNPTSANLVTIPEDWEYSSYREYIGLIKPSKKICNYEEVIDISSTDYRNFVEERIKYQKQLSIIKSSNEKIYSG